MVSRVKGIGEGNAAKFSAQGLTVNGAALKGAPAKTEASAQTMGAKAVDGKASASKPADAKVSAAKTSDKKQAARRLAAARHPAPLPGLVVEIERRRLGRAAAPAATVPAKECGNVVAPGERVGHA